MTVIVYNTMRPPNSNCLSCIVLCVFLIEISEAYQRKTVYGRTYSSKAKQRNDGKCIQPQLYIKPMSLKRNKYVGICGRNNKHPYARINTNELKYPSVFNDLTRKEMKGLLYYLYSNKELNLTKFSNATIRSNYIYLAELYLPPKEAVLNYIDNGFTKPPREAHVILIRGGDSKPNVLEIVVGPLPFPKGYRLVPYRPQPIPFFQRPITSIENISQKLKERINKEFGKALHDLYGGTFINCHNKCLDVAISVQVPITKLDGKRFYWYTFYQNFEYSILRPIDFEVYVETRFENFKILKIWFYGRIFETWNKVRDFYRINKLFFKKIPFPRESMNIPLTMKRRGKPPFSNPLRNPSQISPDGKRYNIKGRKVTYMFWEFDIGMSIITGPRFFDIRFQGQRIVYEISLQELASFYSGYKPTEQNFRFFDSRFLLGLRAKYLMHGVDCPNDATYMSTYFLDGSSEIPVYNSRALCVFELNTGLPLRRHHGYSSTSSHRFYEGMVSIVLTVRTIITVFNYDYIIDIIFYPTGGIEVKVTVSGVIIAAYHGRKNPYGFEISKHLMGLIHQHLFHFKVDMDIKGKYNRFETIDIENDAVSSPSYTNSDSNIQQLKFARKLKVTEKEAAYKHNFKQPKYLVISNNYIKDKFGNTPGYRIVNKGMTYNIYPPGTRYEPGITWSRYQVAVTRRKDNEPGSSSIYQTNKPDEPVVRFQDFIDDDENIVDKDIVAWLTMGLYHIPTKEDLPVTHTPGESLSFFLLPFNYFDENPAMASRNAIRIDPIDIEGKTKSLKVERYGVGDDINCIPPKYNYEQLMKRNPCLVVECLDSEKNNRVKSHVLQEFRWQ